jgi:hypothetical protein
MKLLNKTLGTLLLLAACALSPSAQTIEPQETATDPAASAVKQLASRDPLVRQRGAEELARLEALDHRRMIEGYRLQEKNSRVKLAMDWALFRFGRKESLYEIVGALDSSRSNQAFSYLTTLENPEPIYLFLERMNGNTQIKLLEVLAKIGDTATLGTIEPYQKSFDPKIAEAAKAAVQEIEERLAQAPSDKSSRPRQVVQDESSP